MFAEDAVSRKSLPHTGPREHEHRLERVADQMFTDVLLKAELAIRTAQSGLKDVTEYAIKRYYQRIILPMTQGKTCDECTSENFLPHNYNCGERGCLCSKPRGRRICPNGTCNELYGHFRNALSRRIPYFNNMNPSDWTTCPYSVAHCFVPSRRRRPSINEFDFSAIMRYFINNKCSQELFDFRSNQDTVFRKALGARNRLFHNHSGDELTYEYLRQLIRDLKTILESSLYSCPESEKARKSLEMLEEVETGSFTLAVVRKQHEEKQEVPNKTHVQDVDISTGSKSYTEKERLHETLQKVEVKLENNNNQEKSGIKRLEETKDSSSKNNPDVCSYENGFGFRTEHDNTLRAAYVYQYADKLPSVGFLYSKKGSGTIFRAGSKYGITAWHIVERITDPQEIKENYDFNLLKNDDVNVQFGDRNAHKFKLKGLDIFKSRELDIAVLEFDDNQVLPPPLPLLEHDVFQNQTMLDVAIIGYGHPKIEDQCVTPSAKLLYKDFIQSQINETMSEWQHNRDRLRTSLKINSDVIDRGYNGYDSPHRVLFDTYVGPGASGSPLFTKLDPSSLQVVGVFTSGYPEVAYTCPHFCENVTPYLTFEAGVKMSSIYKEISLRDQTLLKELF